MEGEATIFLENVLDVRDHLYWTPPVRDW